jgi:hypothetical protein
MCSIQPCKKGKSQADDPTEQVTRISILGDEAVRGATVPQQPTRHQSIGGPCRIRANSPSSPEQVRHRATLHAQCTNDDSVQKNRAPQIVHAALEGVPPVPTRVLEQLLAFKHLLAEQEMQRQRKAEEQQADSGGHGRAPSIPRHHAFRV